jgi:hypothetical protein
MKTKQAMSAISKVTFTIHIIFQDAMSGLSCGGKDVKWFVQDHKPTYQ